MAVTIEHGDQDDNELTMGSAIVPVGSGRFKMSRWFRAGSVGLFMTYALAASADTFTVNAQYRGVVKKAFSNLGSSELNFTPAGREQIRVTGTANVDHPKEEGRKYRMRYDMTLKIAPGSIQEVANRNSSNPGSEEALETTEKILPFVHVVKHVPIESAQVSLPYTTSDGDFTLDFAQAPGNLEATLRQNGETLAKFFLGANELSTPRKIEKFRVTTKKGTVLSFVSGGGGFTRR
jgi:hypothetical protein